MNTNLFDMIEEGDDFPGCCGISVTHDFPEMWDVVVPGETQWDPAKRRNIVVTKDRPATAAEIAEDMLERFGQPENHLHLVSLIDCQLQDGWLGVLRKAGFKRLARFRNGIGNVVNLFGHAETEGVPAYVGRGKKGA
jgi:hypothetical protein